MEINRVKDEIRLEKELNDLDLLVIDFTRILNDIDIRFVLVSGYVSILFGRNRASEDIDIIVQKMTKNKFYELWSRIGLEFECLITSNAGSAYDEYLGEKLALRFSRKGEFIPNIEMKFPKSMLDEWTLENGIVVWLNENRLYISPFELQIPYKLFLGSDKDIEDAKYLYTLFKDYLDDSILGYYLKGLKQENAFGRYINEAT